MHVCLFSYLTTFLGTQTVCNSVFFSLSLSLIYVYAATGLHLEFNYIS